MGCLARPGTLPRLRLATFVTLAMLSVPEWASASSNRRGRVADGTLAQRPSGGGHCGTRQAKLLKLHKVGSTTVSNILIDYAST